MVTFAWIILLLAAVVLLSYHRASLIVWTVGLAVYLLLLSYFSPAGAFQLSIYWILFAAIFAPLNIIPFRRQFITRRILAIYRKLMPSMSDTEKEALNAGGVGWTADIFSGMPNWQKLHDTPLTELSEEEQAFLDGPVEQLCQMIDDWNISRSMQIPDEIWNFIKKEGFFGMIIPKKYGGKEFSATMHSQVIVKVSGVSVAVATVIGVPNSLGPAELLLHYGTEEQKNHYLPRLAVGEEIPCFALTSPKAGSDASSITDYGVVCKAEFDGKEQTCIRLTWNKRYITLAPMATILGLAFKLYDPDHILGDQEDIGITCALIPTDTEGVQTGRRHYPLDCAFPNGPTQGEDVIVPIDWVIGGEKMVGSGWRMLMECLSAGRSISLPSMVCGGARRSTLASGSYSRIRRQFNTHIGNFGGVAEALTRMACYTYIADCCRTYTVSSVDQHLKPAVASAISKYHTTELARVVALSAMDVQGGKAICMGPNNYLAQGYIELPIAITVEGANILTRSMIIFGQGAIRCHPYVLPELTAAQDSDKARGLRLFDRALFSHMGFLISNMFRSLIMGLTSSYLVISREGPLKRYYQQFTRYSAILAFTADLCMLVIGAELKRREKLSARLGDLLSLVYMGSAVLKTYHDRGDEEMLPVVHWSCQYLVSRLQNQLVELIHNIPNRWLAWFLRFITLPLGKRSLEPSDVLGGKAAELILAPSKFRDYIGKNLYLTPNDNNPVGKMQDILRDVIAAEPIEKKVHKAMRKGVIKGKNLQELVHAAVDANVLSQTEADLLLKVDELRMSIINVDDFGPEFFDKHK